jgi:hypothetical protein
LGFCSADPRNWSALRRIAQTAEAAAVGASDTDSRAGPVTWLGRDLRAVPARPKPSLHAHVFQFADSNIEMLQRLRVRLVVVVCSRPKQFGRSEMCQSKFRAEVDCSCCLQRLKVVCRS